MVYLKVCWLISKYLGFFSIAYCFQFPVLFHCGQKTYPALFQSFYIYWYLFCGLMYELSCWTYHVQLQSIRILLLLVLCSINANNVKSVNNAACIFYALHIFSSCINLWKACVKISNCGIVYPFIFIKFCLHVVWNSVMRCVYTLTIFMSS